MTVVKVKFRPSTFANRPGSIIYLVTRHRVVRQITTEYKIFPEEWDEKRSRPVPLAGSGRTATIRSILQRSDRDLKKLNHIIEKFDSRNGNYSSEDVVREFQRLRGEISLFPFMEDTIDRLRQLNRIGTANNYRAALGSFRRFLEDRDIPLETVDSVLMEEYQIRLKSDGLAQNSISFYMRILRAVYNRAVRLGLTADRRPFHTVFTGMEKTRKRAIPVSDIKRIRHLDLSSHPHLAFARDMFFFLFFCRGMSLIDAAFLRKTDISGGILSYSRHKTGQQLHIKVIRQIRDLLERYPSPGSPYLLPVITEPGNNERRQYETVLRRTNKALKTVGEMAGLSIRLTTYVARHSWATIAKTKNIPVNIISDALGHESIATTQIYLASIGTFAIDRANDLVTKDL